MKAILMDVVTSSEGKEERLMLSEIDKGIILVELGKKELFTADTDRFIGICRELIDTFGKKELKVEL
jgi:hypothetical protein